MVKTPNYKQDKRRREDAQKKRNLEEQERKAARKGVVSAEELADVRAKILAPIG